MLNPIVASKAKGIFYSILSCSVLFYHVKLKPIPAFPAGILFYSILFYYCEAGAYPIILG